MVGVIREVVRVVKRDSSVVHRGALDVLVRPAVAKAARAKVKEEVGCSCSETKEAPNELAQLLRPWTMRKRQDNERPTATKQRASTIQPLQPQDVTDSTV